MDGDFMISEWCMYGNSIVSELIVDDDFMVSEWCVPGDTMNTKYQDDFSSFIMIVISMQ